MNRRLPSLNPLRAFEAAARLGSLTHAAAELGFSQIAVSRQLRALELYLGVKLFQRSHHSIELTRAGRELQEGASPAFLAIAEALRRFRMWLAEELAAEDAGNLPRGDESGATA